MRRILSIIAAGTIALSACSDDTVGPPANYGFIVVPDQTELSLTQDDSVLVKAEVVDTVSGGHMHLAPLTWTSDDPDVATVAAATGNSWRIRATGGGETTIHVVFDAAKGPVEATIAVAVEANPADVFTLSNSTLSLFPGDTGMVGITLKDAEGNDLSLRRIVWENSDDSVATVAPFTKVWADTITVGGEDSVVVDSVTYHAVVTAADTGTAEIVATVEGIQHTISVTVNLRPVDEITVTPDATALHVDETTTLVATLKAANGETLTGREILWATSDTTIATVDQHGVVTATGAGTATIVAASGGKTAAAKVFVVN